MRCKGGRCYGPAMRQRMFGSVAWALVAAGMCPSCGLLPGAGQRALQEEREKAAAAAEAMPPGLVRGEDSGGGATVSVLDSVQGAGGAPGLPASAGATREEDIVWTDPDDPDAEIPELDTVLKNPARGPWEQSETVARKLAARDGKCLLIWFTDSRRSPNCKTLSAELFSTPDFDKWAAENLVRLRIDSNVAERDMDKRARILDYVKSVHKRLRVLGHPTVVMCAPQGDVIARYRGYSPGQSDFYWGRIKTAVILGNGSYGKWRADLEKRGYREWSDRRGRKVFAQLTAYQDGELWLVEPDGTRSKTHEHKLSDADRLWIAQQKQARGIR